MRLQGRARLALLTVSFVLFLYPVTLGTLSVNYSFLLLPLFRLVCDGRVKKPPPTAVIVMALFTLVFIVAALYQLDYVGDDVRRFVSFLIFMSVFSYMFLEVDRDMVAAFRAAVVIISLLLSVTAIFRFAVLGASSLGFEAKDLLGSQRFGFIYVLAIWLAYLDEHRGRLPAILRLAALVVLLAGVVLTFSRSSVVALVASVGFFVMVRLAEWTQRPRLSQLLKGLSATGALAVMLATISLAFPVVVTFFDERLYAVLTSGSVVAVRLADPVTSEGTRVLLAERIFEFVRNNPLTGSGYLGVWIALGDLSGSAHSQYTDVLFRTGLIGFAAYGYLLFRLLRYLPTGDRPLFWGMIGIMVYGLFHETFKESQGAFVLTFLLGMLAQSLRQRSSALARADRTGRSTAPGRSSGALRDVHR